ncbi:MAG: carboxymuconolactone decarboxylase family protein [Actinobacteria bacterium]|nr:MAG: carboxymuconolactone decarboxylase family protein [Actinomycetota bacterium]
MARIPYPTEAELDDDTRAVLAALPPLNLMRMVAAAPTTLRPLARLGSAILLDTELDARLRELAILTVARVTGSTYEGAQHEEISRLLGMPEEEIAAARTGELDALGDDARLVVRAAEEISRDVRAGDETLAALLERLGHRPTVELVVCVAYYNAIARILETTGVELEEVLPAKGLTPPNKEPTS